MKQEEKDLLLKDLCARLSYGVVVNYNGLARPLFSVAPTQHFQITLDNALDGKHNGLALVSLDVDGEEPKPYLRPMSSMTEEERWDFGRIFNSFEYLKLELLENGLSFHEIYDITGICDITWNELNTAIDWLNSHHFDYRGLIEKDLAIEVTEDNNPYV